MSIDRIGGPKPPLTPAPASPARSTDTGTEFRVGGSIPVEATAPATSEPLARLRAGQVDRAGYVDLHARHATSHLRGLSARTLEQLQQQLRDRCESDPLLSELVARATG